MRTRLLFYIFIVLVVLSLTGQAFAATYTLVPSQVPKGAYVNGPGGATDDNYYWQTLQITLTATHDQPATIDITMPTGMTVADTDGDNAANLSDEVSISYVSAGATIAVDAGGATTTTNIQLDITVGNALTGETIWVMFPVETAVNPGVASAGYAVTYSDVDEPDVLAAAGPQATYSDAGALSVVSYSLILAGDNDTTSTYGQKYPTGAAAALWTALTDYVRDTGASTETFGTVLTPADGDNTNDVTFKLWVSADSTLSHVNIQTSGVFPALNFTSGLNFTVNEGTDGSVANIATAGIPEGNYYFYVTSSLTSDYPLARSGQLRILHYPEVKIVGWDYNDDNIFDNDGVGNDDDHNLTLDTGSYFGYDGAVGVVGSRDYTDIYINVEDYDDNSRIYLYYSSNAALTSSSITTSGSSPNIVVTGLTGATILADTLYENSKNEDGFVVWNWNVTTPAVAANQYTLYVIGNDGKHQSILASKGAESTIQETVTVKQSPSLAFDALAEYDSNTGDGKIDISVANNDVIMISWGKAGVGGDSDNDDAALIELYIDFDTNNNADYASTSAAALRAAVDNLPGGVHRIATGIQENPDSQSANYYAWNLKDDFASTTPQWYPTQGAIYHLYGIIRENKSTGETERVVALGDDGVLTLGEDLTAGSKNGMLIFNNSTFTRSYDPPVDGVTVYGDQTYRIRFNAFDYDENANIGVYVINTGVYTGTGATTVTALETLNTGGQAYCLTSTTGDDAAPAFLLENTATYYDLTMRKPSEANTRYSTDIETNATDMAAGTYFLFVGNPAGTLYRAPGTITFANISDTDDPAQKNLMLLPSVFTVARGDTTTFSVQAADQGGTIDLIDAYIAVEKAYFDVLSPTAPFTDGAGTGTLISNEVIDDATNNRWILHMAVFNSGNALNPADVDLGDVEATFRLLPKGTTNALGISSSVYFVNEPAKGWVSKFMNNGVSVSITTQTNTALVQPSGIVEGIVEFEGRVYSNYQVTFDLRKRGSYTATYDSTLYATNDANSTNAGIQYTLDNDGKFTLWKVPSGTWDLVVSYNRYLAKKQEIKVEAGLDTLFVTFGKLLGGDCIGYTDSSGAAQPNNRINQLDVDRISLAFLADTTHVRWNDGNFNYKWADIDESYKVGIEDLQMATANFTGTSNDGAQPVWAKPVVQLPVSNDGALVEFDNLPTELVAGQKYTTQVVLHNSGSVLGYFVNLKYDTTKLSVDTMTKGDFITTESQWFPVRQEGTVGLANASYGKTGFSGDGVLAEFVFTATVNGAFSPDMLQISEASVVNSNMLVDNLVVSNPTAVNDVPVDFALNQNFPNPFNPTTTISFNIPKNGNVNLKIYNVAGQCVRTLVSGYQSAGNYSVVWDATDMNGSAVSAGVYFYVIEASGYHATKRMMFIK